jgi:hypothetical protein|tara:strand:+ start:987 stop:1613 length:627 start_codon:yes stop_codon:yes gene_type:complete
MQTRTYGDLYKLIQSLSGVGSFAPTEQDDVANFINRRFSEAYNTSQMWPRYLVAGESRVLSADQAVTYAEAGKDTIGEFIRIHRNQPFLNNSTVEYEFYVDAIGAHILNVVSSSDSGVFVTYKKPFEVLTTSSDYLNSTESVPAEFFHFIAHTSYADFLRMDGQTDKALIEEQTGEKYLALELERVDLITNNNTVNNRFSTYVNRQAR